MYHFFYARLPRAQIYLIGTAPNRPVDAIEFVQAFTLQQTAIEAAYTIRGADGKPTLNRELLLKHLWGVLAYSRLPDGIRRSLKSVLLSWSSAEFDAEAVMKAATKDGKIEAALPADSDNREIAALVKKVESLSAALDEERSDRVDLEEAMFAGGGRGRNFKTSSSMPRREPWCNNCNEPGHMRKDCTKNCCVSWCNAAPGCEHKKGCKYRWVDEATFQLDKQRRAASSSSSSARANAVTEDAEEQDPVAVLKSQILKASAEELLLLERKMKLLGGDFASDSDSGVCSSFATAEPLFTIYEAQPTTHAYSVPSVSAATARRQLRWSVAGRSDAFPISVEPCSERPAPLSGPVGAGAGVQVSAPSSPGCTPTPAPAEVAPTVQPLSYAQRGVAKDAVKTSSFGSRCRAWPVAMLAASLLASVTGVGASALPDSPGECRCGIVPSLAGAVAYNRRRHGSSGVAGPAFVCGASDSIDALHYPDCASLSSLLPFLRWSSVSAVRSSTPTRMRLACAVVGNCTFDSSLLPARWPVRSLIIDSACSTTILTDASLFESLHSSQTRVRTASAWSRASS